MKLTKKSLLIRWAYLPEIILSEKGEEPKIPAKTTLCEILTRGIFGTTAFVFLFLPLAAVLYCAIAPMEWVEESLPKAKLVIRIKSRWKGSVIRWAILDFKEKTCTRVEIE